MSQHSIRSFLTRKSSDVEERRQKVVQLIDLYSNHLEPNDDTISTIYDLEQELHYLNEELRLLNH